jgi:hypothetical protein
MTQYSPSRCSWLEEWVVTSFEKIVMPGSEESPVNETIEERT